MGGHECDVRLQITPTSNGTATVLEGQGVCLPPIYKWLKDKELDISMVVICYASDVIKYGRRTPELSNTPLHMKQDTTSIEQ